MNYMPTKTIQEKSKTIKKQKHRNVHKIISCWFKKALLLREAEVRRGKGRERHP